MARAGYLLEFELAYNTYTDLSADWHAPTPLVIERGLEPGERVAGVGRMTLGLYNPDGRYTPGHPNATAGFGVGSGVRLRAVYDGQTHTLFYGRLAGIIPRGPGGEPVAMLTVRDEIAALERARLRPFALRYAVTPGALIADLVAGAITPPGAHGFWRLAHPAAGTLGDGTSLAGAGAGTDYDAGQSVFPWAGDTWPPGTPLIDALRDVCASEGGFFYLRADGSPVFDDRHARPRRVEPDAALSARLSGLRLEWLEPRAASRVEVTAYPREVGTGSAVLWSAGTALRLRPGQTREIAVTFRDPEQEALVVGAQDVVAPQPGTDYTASTKLDPTHPDAIDVTAFVTVTAAIGAAGARLTLVNGWEGAQTIYVHGMQVRGVPLRAFRPVTAAVEDDAARFAYGERVLRVDMPLQDDPAVAADMARGLLAARSSPLPWLAVHLEGAAGGDLLAHMLARDVGDRLHLTDDETGLDAAACFIDGVRHVIDRGGARHRVTWRTSPADREAWWLLGQAGYAALGVSTRAGY